MAPPSKRQKAQKVNPAGRWPKAPCTLCNKKRYENERLREKNRRLKGKLNSVSTSVAALTSAINLKFGPSKATGKDLLGLLSSALMAVRKYAKKVKRAGKARMEKHEEVLGQKRAAEDQLKSAQKRTHDQSARQSARHIAKRLKAVGKWKDKYASLKRALGRQLEARDVVHTEALCCAAKTEAELQQAQALRVAAERRAGIMAAEAAATAKATSEACKREQAARRLQQAAKKEAMSAVGEMGALFAEAKEEKEKRKEAETGLEKSARRLEEKRAKNEQLKGRRATTREGGMAAQRSLTLCARASRNGQTCLSKRRRH